jgi:hypothetical protein
LPQGLTVKEREVEVTYEYLLEAAGVVESAVGAIDEYVVKRWNLG